MSFSPSGACTNREVLTQFIDQANNSHPTIKFTAEISDTETTFLDTSVYKGEKFIYESVLDIRTHYKPTETFQYTHFSSRHPPGVKNTGNSKTAAARGGKLARQLGGCRGLHPLSPSPTKENQD